MKVFILEDDENRIDFFTRNLNTKVECIAIAKNIYEGIKILSEDTFDILFLDHDLGEPEIPENTGSGLAKFIVNNKIKCNEIFIHSMSPVGAQNIKNILDNGNYESSIIPFTNIQSLILKIIRRNKIEK